MKIKIIDWLRKPFPQVASYRDIMIISLGSGVVVLSFLIIFQPFGIESVKGIFFYLFGFALIDFTVTAINLLLGPRIFPFLFKSSRWTLGKNLLAITWILLTIALVNFVYGEYLVGQGYVEALRQLNRTGILSWIFMTFSVGIIPVVLALYFIEKMLGRRNQSMAEEYNKGIQAPQAKRSEQVIIIESGKDTRLQISSIELICVQSEGGNYITVYWYNESGLHKEMIRYTLVGFMKQAEHIENIVRCHKSYIINLYKVQSFRGNARTVTVILEGLDFEVPVSRSFPRKKLENQA